MGFVLIRKGNYICGPTSVENQAQAESQALTNEISSAFNGRFASQSQINQLLQNSLSPIVAAGPSQQGMSAQEQAALNTANINSNAAAARNAEQAAANAGAGMGGGGDTGLISGPQQQIRGAIASQAAANTAAGQNAIIQKNYDIGRQNWQIANAGLQGLSGLENPAAFSGQAINANEASFGEAEQTAQQKAQELSAIGGAIETGVGALSGGLSGGIANLGPNEEGNTNTQDFFSGFFGGLGGK